MLVAALHHTGAVRAPHIPSFRSNVVLVAQVFMPEICAYKTIYVIIFALQAMSGTPDWKPGLRARPSSLAGSTALVPVAPVVLRASPSSIDLSGRHEHAPIASQVGDPQSKHVRKRAICDTADEDKQCNRHVRARGGSIFGGDTMPVPVPSDTPRASPPDSRGPASSVFSMVDIPTPPVAQAYGLAGLGTWQSGRFIDQGWKTGAYFRHIVRPGLAHRVYDGPPDGTPRVRLGPEEVMVDFVRPYKIYALFVNDVYLAAQIKIPEQLNMSGFISPSMYVWSNVRRGDEWWAKLHDAELARELETAFSRGTPDAPQLRNHPLRIIALRPGIAEVEVD